VRVAAIDLGTNSMRLLVVDDAGGELHREAVVTGLGRGVDATGRFAADRLDATIEVVAGFAATAAALGVDRIGAVATSAARDAANGGDLLEGVAAIVGTPPEVISGEAEAALAFAGATAGRDFASPCLVIDIGGGSTEFVQDQGVSSYARSIDLGSVRLTERCLPHRPASAEEIEGARREADRLLAAVDLPDTPAVVVGVAGTFTSLAAIDAGLGAYDRDVVDGWVLADTAIGRLVAWLSGRSLAEMEAIAALDPRRAPVILAGAIIAERALAVTRQTSVVCSERDLLDGFAARLLV